MSPQLNGKRQAFSRLSGCRLQGGYTRILRASKTAFMRIDTFTQAIDMQQIDNRRFLFNPRTGVLVLGRQYKETSVVNASHAVELADAGITKDCDDFVRGWIGVGGAFLTE